jgi:putative holliday junction resolvase
MNGRTYMAFDFGERRIGVAIGNDLTESANPLTTIDATTDEARFSAIEPLVNDW